MAGGEGEFQAEGIFTIERCTEIALANNPEIAATGWEVSAAGSRVKQSQAQRWPAVSAEAGYTSYLDPQRLIQARYNGEPGFFDRDIYRADVILKMPIFTGGRIVNEIAAADLLYKAEEHRLARSREELLFNVASTFYSILAQRKIIHSIDFSVEAMEKHLKQISDLLAAQKAAKVDLLRTEVRLSDLRQGLVKEENVLAIQKRVLANLMGLDYNTERFAFEGKLVFEELDITGTAILISRALEQRSDYGAAKERLEAQARRVDIAKAGHAPTVSVLGGYGVRADSYGDDGNVGSIGVGVTIPLFEGGRVVAKVAEERSTLAAARERLRKLELQIRQDVETALLDIRASSERVKALDKSIEQARESLRIERQKYELGMGSITDVLDAQSALLQSETNYYRALADLDTAIARLKYATGGQPS
jgi:outer membrane protein TolC